MLSNTHNKEQENTQMNFTEEGSKKVNWIELTEGGF